jgi:hypothetical protein
MAALGSASKEGLVTITLEEQQQAAAAAKAGGKVSGSECLSLYADPDTCLLGGGGGGGGGGAWG